MSSSFFGLANETGYNISSILLADTSEENKLPINDCTSSKVSVTGPILTEAEIIRLLGRPIMTEEERLYRKISRRSPYMLELAAKKGLLCESE